MARPSVCSVLSGAQQWVLGPLGWLNVASVAFLVHAHEFWGFFVRIRLKTVLVLNLLCCQKT